MKQTARQIILKQVADMAEGNALFSPGDRIIAAVSGGADSVALLDILSSLPCYTLQLVVAHLNHLLRGDESDADEQFVRNLASKYGLLCESARIDVKGFSKKEKISLEEAAREVRYRFLEDARIKHNASAIAVAHHANDQAETFLMRLIRGSGTAGLSSMSVINSRRIIRPLLKISASELKEYLNCSNLEFREDSTNSDRTFLRNSIRHDLLPRLSGYNPSIIQRLSETAAMIADDELLLDGIVEQHWSEMAEWGEGWIKISRKRLLNETQAMRMRLYRKTIQKIVGNLRGIELKHCTALDFLIKNGITGKGISLPCGLSARLTREMLLMAKNEVLISSSPSELDINSPGKYPLGNGLAILVDITPTPENLKETPGWITYVDIEKAPINWKIRPLQRGDRISPIGMKGSRLASDILSEAHLPSHLRKAIPIVTCEAGPLWLAGFRRSTIAAISEESSQVARISIEGLEFLDLFQHKNRVKPV